MQTLHQTSGNYNYLHIDWGDEKEAQISKQFSKYYKKIQESHLTLKICESEVYALFCTVEVLGLHIPRRPLLGDFRECGQLKVCVGCCTVE